MKNLKLLSVLIIASISMQPIHGMQYAKKLFHTTCAGLSYAIQGVTTYAGAKTLMHIAKAKYGNDDDFRGGQAWAYKHALEANLIREELS